MELYLGKCLDSLLIPEFDQVEVLIINDGSKDRSTEIAHRYANRYPASIRVIDKVNGNYGSCINVALPLCTGRYVKILDADDTFDTQAFSKFVNSLYGCNEDVIVTNFATLTEDGQVVEKTSFATNTIISKRLQINDCSILSFVCMHRITYKRELFNQINYRQTEGISYTDTEWSIIPFVHCKTIRFLDLLLYRYLLGREGQTMDPKSIAKSLTQLFMVLNSLTESYSTFNGSPSAKALFKQFLIERHIYVYFQSIHLLNKANMPAFREYDEHLKGIAPEIYDSLNNVQYTSKIDFPVFKYIRDNSYKAPFSLPLLKRIELMIKVRLNRFICKK